MHFVFLLHVYTKKVPFCLCIVTKKLIVFLLGLNVRIIRSNINIREDPDENNKFFVYIYKTNKFYLKYNKLLRVEIKFNVII